MRRGEINVNWQRLENRIKHKYLSTRILSYCMKRSPLKRSKHLKRKPMKRRVVSEKMKAEYARRKAVYAYLWEHCPTRDGVRICVHCGRNLDWHWKGHEMHHLKHIQMGGCKDNTRTTPENCTLICSVCHFEAHGIKSLPP